MKQRLPQSILLITGAVKMKEEDPKEEVSDDFYSDIRREEMLDNDELDPNEAAFMEGYDAALNVGE